MRKRKDMKRMRRSKMEKVSLQRKVEECLRALREKNVFFSEKKQDFEPNVHVFAPNPVR